jgi:hypothetical protein
MTRRMPRPCGRRAFVGKVDELIAAHSSQLAAFRDAGLPLPPEPEPIVGAVFPGGKTTHQWVLSTDSLLI